jgi:two-component system sensor histidine kinase/response regulator
VLTGDLLRLVQVLTNLLGNAIKFSAKGEIEIGIVDMPTTQMGKTKLHLWVRDTGIGMNAEQVAKIFDAFSQADASTTRRFGGTGLGLTICKRIVELMDGEIKVQSQPNHGSRFDVFVYLPNDTPPESPVLANASKRSLLIVDNNVHSALAIKSIVERLQWQADVLTDLNETSQIVATHYDFVLLDADFATDDYSVYLPTNVPKVLLQTPWQESDPMLGSTIDFATTLTKPIDEQTLLSLTVSSTAKNTTIEEKPLLAYRILLVEDNTINQLVGVKLLETLGAEVDVAENGHVALSLLQQVGVYYDVVLMDLQMPIMDGLETTRQLRLIEQFADLPVIAMTANVMATDREACFEAGMNDFMSKPIRLQELRTKVLQWVK